NPYFPVNTLLLMRGAVAAEEDGRLLEYLAAGMKQMWEDGLAMHEPEVFSQAMTDAGFDGEDLLGRTQDPDIKARLVENTSKAVDRGVFGIPTFFISDEMFFGKERLGQMEEFLSVS
ncbi:MAG: DsbA family protein, partial [Pseudomonadota bacterium]